MVSRRIGESLLIILGQESDTPMIGPEVVRVLLGYLGAPQTWIRHVPGKTLKPFQHAQIPQNASSV